MLMSAQPRRRTLIRVVGDLAVTRDGVTFAGAELGSRKARALLGLLVAERGHVVSVDRVVEALWDARPPARPAENVATLASRLRRDLGAELVVGGRGGYRLGEPPDVVVDVDDAAGWIDEAERRFRSGEPALALATAERAGEKLAAGDVLAGESARAWVEPLRVEYAALRARLRHVVADAALTVGDAQRALSAARAAMADDPYDERSARAAMRAHAAAGEPGAALATYAALRSRLADDLGADPAPETADLNVAILRSRAPRADPVPSPDAVEPAGLVGRADELRRLRDAWHAAAGGRPGLVLVAGEAGIGKSRLCAELVRTAEDTGGIVASARCYETERSLFLQPVVEAVGGLAKTLAPAVFRDAAGDFATTLAGLVPEAAAVLGMAPPRRRGSAAIERRLAFDATGALLRALSVRAPVLVVLDDMQNAGRSTVEFTHYLLRRLTGDRVLVVASVRSEEGAGVIDTLADVASHVDLGPLSEQAVYALAATAGLADHAAEITRRTGGHPLYVVETLRALADGVVGSPPSLEAAVTSRVRRAGRSVEESLRAASVLGRAFDPTILSALLGAPVRAVAAACEDALTARLLVVAGRSYEFAHDLVGEVLYATTPAPTRLAYHHRAADLLTDRPEAMAGHALAAGDSARAARAFLLAGEQALARAAAADAAELLSRSLDAASEVDDAEDVRSRALLVRGRARAAAAEYAAALRDIEQAAAAARECGDRRLEVLALRELGGEIPTALGRPVADCLVRLDRALDVATSLSDRLLQADVQAWIAILAANGLRFAEAVEHGAQAVHAARATGDVEALAAALDGRKTSLAYLGEVGELAPVIDKLDPLLRRLGDLFRLHWTVFESAFPALARGDWLVATERVRAAIEVQRRSGFTAYAGWHVAHLGWIARLQGRYDEAIELGRRALELCDEATHVWCVATAAGLHGTTLLEAGRVDDAVRVLERARAVARQDGAEAHQLRVLAPLAEATGSRAVLDEADALVAGITAPPGSAFVVGDWCYLAVARAWLRHGEPERARSVLAPLLVAAERVPWVGALAAASLVDASAAAVLGRTAEAERGYRRAASLAQRYGLPRVERDAARALGS